MGYKVGVIEFTVSHRDASQVDEGVDGGDTVRVYTDLEGQRVQLLRFDMFKIRPHFHYAPDGKNEEWNLDPLTTGDTIEWAREQIRTRLPEMIAQAGYEEVAQQVDTKAIASVLPHIEAALRSGADIP